MDVVMFDVHVIKSAAPDAGCTAVCAVYDTITHVLLLLYE